MNEEKAIKTIETVYEKLLVDGKIYIAPWSSNRLYDDDISSSRVTLKKLGYEFRHYTP